MHFLHVFFTLVIPLTLFDTFDPWSRKCNKSVNQELERLRYTGEEIMTVTMSMNRMSGVSEITERSMVRGTEGEGEVATDEEDIRGGRSRRRETNSRNMQMSFR